MDNSFFVVTMDNSELHEFSNFKDAYAYYTNAVTCAKYYEKQSVNPLGVKYELRKVTVIQSEVVYR